MIQGIDISVAQGKLDWARVDSSIKFVIHRCGVGNDKPDTCFDDNIAGARASGRIVGAYHFVYPLATIQGHEDRDPVAQAEAHFEASRGLGSFQGELPPFVDLEWPIPDKWSQWGCTAEQIKAWALAYLIRSDQLHGRRAGIYLYPDFAKHLGDLSAFKNRSLWLASYQKIPACIAPWIIPDIWQSTGGGGKLYNGTPVDTDVIASDDVLTDLLGGRLG